MTSASSHGPGDAKIYFCTRENANTLCLTMRQRADLGSKHLGTDVAQDLMWYFVSPEVALSVVDTNKFQCFLSLCIEAIRAGMTPKFPFEWPPRRYKNEWNEREKLNKDFWREALCGKKIAEPLFDEHMELNGFELEDGQVVKVDIAGRTIEPSGSREVFPLFRPKFTR